MRVLGLWERALDAIEAGNLDAIAREIDWAIKYQLIQQHWAGHDMPLSAPEIRPRSTWLITTSNAAAASTTSWSAAARSSGPRATSTSSRRKPLPPTPGRYRQAG